jgi:hypothetical protein
MKKSKIVQLVLISAALASCHRKKPEWQAGSGKVYMRSDTTAPYQDVGYYGGYTRHGYTPLPWLWYYAFRPYGTYYDGTYHHAGYYSGGIGERSNIGFNSGKAGIVRGGFGGRGVGVSS